MDWSPSVFCVVYYRPKSYFFGVNLRTEFGFNDILLGSQAFNLRTMLSEKVGIFMNRLCNTLWHHFSHSPVNQAQPLY